MKFRHIDVLEADSNKKGDLFGRLMGDLFHALGYGTPRLNIHKSGREIDLHAEHRTERKVAIAECKAHTDTIGGGDVNKFIGAFDAESRTIKKRNPSTEPVAYFISLSGFKETTIEQENQLDSERVILLDRERVITELINGKILVAPEKAIAAASSSAGNGFTVCDHLDLLAHRRGWVWVVYFSENSGQSTTHYTLVHAEGNLLVPDIAKDVQGQDRKTNKRLVGLTYLPPLNKSAVGTEQVTDARSLYFRYLELECGEIQFEGLPTDKDAGAVRVRLENIFVPLHVESIGDGIAVSPRSETAKTRKPIGDILAEKTRLAILAKPGGGKSTLLKRLAMAYAFPERRDEVNDRLPNRNWLPLFIRCRELGPDVRSSITEIIGQIPRRAEIKRATDGFMAVVSDSLQNGSAMLLIDGLDEISDEQDRVAFVTQLRTFVATYPTVGVITTSREAGFRAVAGPLATYCEGYRLSPFEGDEIVNLTLRWHRAIIDDTEKTQADARSVAEIILGDPRIFVLAQNPLMLTTLLFVKRWVGYLPTKRTLLYQEMIKLLLVTWNVQGHAQLDIDETEPQLAFVAFWMTTNGLQTISERQLKSALTEARKQLPDVLGYTPISVPNFIKSVEARSSLLIMSGHERESSGELVPVYEFLHLSFQEYLSAKAIAEGYLPGDIASEPVLDVLKPNLYKETWKEIVPLVAVLAKKNNRPLIEFLIKETKRTAGHEEPGPLSPSVLLGSCLENEIQIAPELLDSAMEWYAKSYDSRLEDLSRNILNGKFGQLFRDKVLSCYYGPYDDLYASSLSGCISEFAFLDSHGEIERIVEMMMSADRRIQGNGSLALMQFAFQYRYTKDRLDNLREEVVQLVHQQLSSEDQQLQLAASWALAWFAEKEHLTREDRLALSKVLTIRWVVDNNNNLSEKLAWALSEVLSPNFVEVTEGVPNIKMAAMQRFSSPRHTLDRLIAIYLGFLLKLEFNQELVVNTIRDLARSQRVLGPSIKEFAHAMDIKLG